MIEIKEFKIEPPKPVDHNAITFHCEFCNQKFNLFTLHFSAFLYGAFFISREHQDCTFDEHDVPSPFEEDLKKIKQDSEHGKDEVGYMGTNCPSCLKTIILFGK